MNASLNLDDGILTVIGTSNRDFITVEYNPDDDDEILVTVRTWNGLTPGDILIQEDIDLEDVDRIIMRGMESGDFLGNATSVSAAMEGNDGDDVIQGGGGDDALLGGAGGDLYLFDNSAASADIAYQFSDFFVTQLGHDVLLDQDEATTLGDTLSFSAMDSGIYVSLRGTNAQIVSSALTLELEGANMIRGIVGTEFDDWIFDNDLDNWILGGGGRDHITAEVGDDFINGGQGDDTYHFTNASDFNLGADEIAEGSGAGSDTLDFSQIVSTSGIGMQINLGILAAQNIHFPTAMTSFNLSLELNGSQIEKVIGTDANDLLIGDAFTNHLVGRGGSDDLEGKGGDDTLEGGLGNDEYRFRNDVVSNLGSDHVIERNGEGTDLLTFANMTRGILIDLALSSQQTVALNTLRLTLDQGSSGIAEIEKVTGSDFADTIRANDLANTILGRDGADWIYGRGGADTIRGGDGSDHLFGGSGMDILHGDDHNDFLYGGDHRDTLFGGDGADYLNGDSENETPDGYADQLYGNTSTSNNDSDSDWFVVYWRYRSGQWRQEEYLFGFEDGIDQRHDIFTA